MVACLILYGSRARGDHRLQSDIDLLGLVEASQISRERNRRGLNFHTFPFHTALDKARSGDLFVAHIVHEGVAIHDPFELFPRLTEEFSFRESYKKERKEATYVALYIRAKRASFFSDALKKRASWAIRTLIISAAAEEKKAIFSSSDLESYSGISGLKSFIEKRATQPVASYKSYLRACLKRFGSHGVIRTFPKTTSERRSRLLRVGGIAASTVKIVEDGKTPKTVSTEHERISLIYE